MKRVIRVLLSVLLAAVFIYAGVIKAFNTASFYQDVRAYHLLTNEMAWRLAHFLPWLEMVAGVGLLVKSTRFMAHAIISLLLLVFILALSSAWIRGLNIECGCFSSSSSPPSYAWMLIRDSLMLFAAIFLLVSDPKQSSRAALPSTG